MIRRLIRFAVIAGMAVIIGGFFAFAAYVERHNGETPGPL